MEKFAFYDKCPIEHNSEAQIFYVAAGLITDIAEKGAVASGKELLTVHVDPLGHVIREWRAYDEIKMYTIGESDYDYAIHCITELEKNADH